MRVKVKDFKSGTINVDVGSNNNGATFTAITPPVNNGVGASANVSALGTFNTVVVTGSFQGTVTVEISEDGTDWGQLFSFTAGGFNSKAFVAQFMRVRRSGIATNIAPGTPVIGVGAINDPITTGGGGGDGYPLNDVTDFGAVGDGVTDDRAAIQSAVDDAVANGIGGIIFPGGVFAVTRNDAGNVFASIDLRSITDFMVMGVGPSSIIKQIGSGDNGDWYVMRLSDCVGMTFKDFVIDGNKANLTDLDEQTHGINLSQGSTPTTAITIHNCTFKDMFGDGIRWIGTVGAECAGHGSHIRAIAQTGQQ